MTTHVCILGIDGSGKSTVANALPGLLSGLNRIRTAGAGESFCVEDPDKTILAPGFSPSGRPILTRLASWWKRAAKRCTDHRVLHPVLKILQLAFQDAAARRLERRYQPGVLVSDGNLILSVAGCTVNTFRPARTGEGSWDVGSDRLRDLLAPFDGHSGSERWIRAVVKVGRALKWLGFQTLWLPDVVILLDLTPERALDRVRRRGGKVDAHENRVDLARARGMYLATADAFEGIRGASAVVRIPVGDRTPGAVIQRVVDSLKGRLETIHSDAAHETLGTTEDGGGAWTSYLSVGYLFRCLVAQFFQGTWREPLFPLSRMGRHFMREGYSASVMQDIYDQDLVPPSLIDRPFVGYPLHRAVYDRLHLLVPRIAQELLGRDGRIRIFTAPSGLAEDVFRAVEDVARVRRGGVGGIEITALDLDPDGRIAKSLAERSERLSVQTTFVKGDLTDPVWSDDREQPFDIAIFVGLSSWLPKPQLIEHLRQLRKNLSDDGVLITDVFTPGAYAVSGWYAGYDANYHQPDTFATLLEVCGFDGRSVAVASGRDGLNHVMVCRPRMVRQVPVGERGAELEETAVEYAMVDERAGAPTLRNV